MRSLLAAWQAYERALDLVILWPACKRRAPDLEMARRAFITHMAIDPAWRHRFHSADELGDWVREHLV